MKNISLLPEHYLRHDTTRQIILALIEDRLKVAPYMTDRALGWRLVKDSSLVPRLRSGGDITTEKLDKIISYFLEYFEPERARETIQ